jgi:hypothetical protein
MGVRDTFHKLMNGSDRIRSHVRASIIEDHIENQIKQRIRQVNADLTARIRNGIHQLY